MKVYLGTVGGVVPTQRGLRRVLLCGVNNLLTTIMSHVVPHQLSTLTPLPQPQEYSLNISKVLISSTFEHVLCQLEVLLNAF